MMPLNWLAASFMVAATSLPPLAALAGWVPPNPRPPGPTPACVHSNLSAHLRIAVGVRRFRPAAGSLDSAAVVLTLTDKQGRRPAQTIRFVARQLFSTAYTDCNAVRSYATGLNQKAQVLDNDYGDVVVADFNFDGRDDVAVKLDSGGNAGPLYGFYVQQPGGAFKLNSFLTSEMQFFPAQFDVRRRTLTTQVHANYRQQRQTTYQLNARTGAWQQVRERLLP